MERWFTDLIPDVLVLSGQNEVRQTISSVLRLDFKVHLMASGKQLLEYLDSGQTADLILLDADMPPPDGYELFAQLQSLPQMPELPILVLTGRNSVEDEVRGLELGAVDCISKPLSPLIFLARVKHHVRIGRLQRLVMEQSYRLIEKTALKL